jgi:putative sporulation protein YyaC
MIKVAKDTSEKPLCRYKAVKRNVNLLAEKIAPFINNNTQFICIGSDTLYTGDSVGPRVGRILESNGFTNVIGTTKAPVHALNLKSIVKDISSESEIIAIDACFSKSGKPDRVNKVSVICGPLKPGSGVDNELPQVGNLSINASIGEDQKSRVLNFEYLRNVKTETVDSMARFIADAIKKAYEIRKLSQNNCDEGVEDYVLS